jgi:hypothetical protein
MLNLYYEPPSDECFEDLKENAIKLWQTYDDTYGYATEKIDRIKHIQNVGDNFMYMYAMFDWINQAKVKSMCKPETVNQLLLRLNN